MAMDRAALLCLSLLLLFSLLSTDSEAADQLMQDEVDAMAEFHAQRASHDFALSRKNKFMLEKGDFNDPESSGNGFFDATFTSLSMIIVSEIGDETFIIAALMAMRYPRSIVLSGALSALFIMTVLSTGLGVIVPNLISRKHTNSAATVLYTFFGLRLLYIAWRSDSGTNQHKEFEESFILTFLAEWGDRSQIATIALATHKNVFGVTLGATVGHTICTTLAVVGGRLLALKISQRTVAAIGGLLFLGFALSSYFYPPL